MRILLVEDELPTGKNCSPASERSQGPILQP